MRVVTAVMGYALYLLGLELSRQLAPRWVWVWWLGLILHSLLVLTAMAVSLVAAVTRKVKGGAPGSRPGIRLDAPPQTKGE